MPGASLSGESKSHQNFLKVVYQVNNIACLFGQNDDGSLSAEYVTPSFVTLMECDTQEEALKLMDGGNLFSSVWPEDRKILRDILDAPASANGDHDITVRLTTWKGNLIWCTIQFTSLSSMITERIISTRLLRTSPGGSGMRNSCRALFQPGRKFSSDQRRSACAHAGQSDGRLC